MVETSLDIGTYVASVFIALLAGLGSGFFLHIHNNRSTRKGLARMLYGELQANHRVVETLASVALPIRPEIFDDVYLGLLYSGNMRHLAKHQESLYTLYASMRNNDRGVAEEIVMQMTALRSSM